MDTSGSCHHLAPKFLKLYKSIPRDKFLVVGKTFGERVAPIKENKDGEINYKQFGGTYFSILERDVQKDLKNNIIKKYPDAIFVITDGYGNDIKPQFPKKWIWLLSEKYTACIPKESKIFNLNKFKT